jgi:hypothetical protein
MDDPISAIIKAIHTATHRATKNLMGFGGIVLSKEGDLKKEDVPRYEMLLSELLYFYMHITLRLAHGQRFSEPEITKLQHEAFPPMIEGMVEGPYGHWPEGAKAKIKAEHYQNANSAELEFASCKEVYPTGDPLAVGNSVYATLARNVEKQLGRPHDPTLSLTIVLEASEQLRGQSFPELLKAAHKVIKSR